MDEHAKRAALRTLEHKLTRQQLAVDATLAMIDLLRNAPDDPLAKREPKK